MQQFSFNKMHLKMSAKWWPFSLSLNVFLLQFFTTTQWPTLISLLSLLHCFSAWSLIFSILFCSPIFFFRPEISVSNSLRRRRRCSDNLKIWDATLQISERVHIVKKKYSMFPRLELTIPSLVQAMAWCQGIAWANADPDACCHVASLGHNEFI